MTRNTREADIQRAYVIVRHTGRRAMLVSVSDDVVAPVAHVVWEPNGAAILPASDVICGTCGDTVDACKRNTTHDDDARV